MRHLIWEKRIFAPSPPGCVTSSLRRRCVWPLLFIHYRVRSLTAEVRDQPVFFRAERSALDSRYLIVAVASRRILAGSEIQEP